MKFIETDDGYFVNPAQVRYFHVDNGKIRAVFGNFVDSHGRTIDRDEVTMFVTGNRDDALRWLKQSLADVDIDGRNVI